MPDPFSPLSFQQLAAVETGRLDQENQQHDGKGRHLRQRGLNEGSQRDDLTDDKGGGQGSLDAAQPADDDHHEDESKHV